MLPELSSGEWGNKRRHNYLLAMTDRIHFLSTGNSLMCYQQFRQLYAGTRAERWTKKNFKKAGIVRILVWILLTRGLWKLFTLQKVQTKALSFTKNVGKAYFFVSVCTVYICIYSACYISSDQIASKNPCVGLPFILVFCPSFFC